VGIHWIYNFSAVVGDKDEWFRFLDHTWCDKHLWRHFSHISGRCGRILAKLITITYYQVHMTVLAFSGSWVRVKVIDNISRNEIF